VSGLGSQGANAYAVGLTRCVVEEAIDPESGAPVDAFVVSLAIDPTTPSGRIELIVGQIETLSDAARIDSGAFTAMTSPLETALAALEAGKTQVATAAIDAFVQVIANYLAHDVLTASEAEALTSAALAVASDL
jgi:hypothetical protein